MPKAPSNDAAMSGTLSIHAAHCRAARARSVPKRALQYNSLRPLRESQDLRLGVLVAVPALSWRCAPHITSTRSRSQRRRALRGAGLAERSGRRYSPPTAQACAARRRSRGSTSPKSQHPRALHFTAACSKASRRNRAKNYASARVSSLGEPIGLQSDVNSEAVEAGPQARFSDAAASPLPSDIPVRPSEATARSFMHCVFVGRCPTCNFQVR